MSKLKRLDAAFKSLGMEGVSEPIPLSEARMLVEMDTSVKPEKEKCGIKIRYKTKREAETVKKIRLKSGSQRLRIYRCELCGGWHLTSQFKK